jgi:S1-C subfamily serine protease
MKCVALLLTGAGLLGMAASSEGAALGRSLGATHSLGSSYYGLGAAPPSYFSGESVPAYTSAPQTKSGLRIDQVLNGSVAQQAKLHAGEIIISVGTTRTQSFAELQQALAASKNGVVYVTYLDPTSNKVATAELKPVDGKIGVAVSPVDLP